MPHPAVALSTWVDPASVFAGLAAEHPHVFWLDAGPAATDGWSWLGMGEPQDEDTVRAVRCAPAPPAGDIAFRGGWVGWASYDPAARLAGAPAAAADDDVPPGLWLRATAIAAFDHAERRVWALAPDADAFAARMTQWSTEASFLQQSADPSEPPALPAQAARARHSPSQYAGLIERCRDAIREGDAYQLCLTTRFSVDGPVDPVAAYAALRAATPAHHGGMIRAGKHALLSASPERFLQVAGGIVRTRPIKGTRPRGTDEGTDAALRHDLVASEKERAENVMIVDLMRNDLARVCDPATVAVERLLDVESYPAVHQLVSTIAGRLRDDTTVGGLLDAAFPAGSMTGAPKLSAMTILHDLERGPRGVFAGCFGWVGDDGAVDLAMVIRSIVTGPGGAYVGAGGGITWRSDAAAEVAEVALKARAPLAALGAQLPPGW